MNRIVLMLAISMMTVTACKKEAAVEAAPEKAAEDRLKWGDQVPNDDKSKAFAAELVQSEITNLRVTDDGAVLTYRTVKFNANGSWVANGDVKIADEKMECSESGTWTMEASDNKTSGRVEYIIAKTNCAGREAGGSQRASIDLASGTPDIRFR